MQAMKNVLEISYVDDAVTGISNSGVRNPSLPQIGMVPLTCHWGAPSLWANNVSYWSIFAPVMTKVPISVFAENGSREIGTGGPVPAVPINLFWMSAWYDTEASLSPM